jgi:uncharacterized protein
LINFDENNTIMLQLSEIWIYPVKSFGGISLSQAQVTDRGLEHDRRWLLVDKNGTFLSQRENPELALFQTEIGMDFLNITHREKAKTIQVPLRQSFSENEKKIIVTVWDDTIEAYEVDQTSTDWFTEILGFEAHLVYMPDESHRKVEAEYAVTESDINSFSDGYPFLIIGQSSLDDLNSRLKQSLPMNRFRPNFVFTGGLPYAEESWKEFAIGDLSFFGVKPCGRCIMTTVDQEKGKQSGKDPLRTLAKYKKEGNNVIFGQNLIASGTGCIGVGNELKILKKSGL